MNIAICDDDEAFCKTVADMLVNTPKWETAHRVKIYHSGEELLFHMEDNHFDLLLLDIVFGPDEISGFKIGELAQQKNPRLPIMFLTDYPEYALQGYKYHPEYFLPKAEIRQELMGEIKRIEMKQDGGWSSCLNYKVRGGYERIEKSEIYHIEIRSHTAYIYSQELLFRKSHMKLSDILNDLSDPRFFQPHKSYIVNLEKIQRVAEGYTHVYMKNGKTVPISQGRKQQIIRYMAWYDTRARGNYERND